MVKTARVFLLSLAAIGIGSLQAQQPTPQQIQQAQQAIKSGTVTPQMIEAARAQNPALRNYSDEQLKAKAEEMQAGQAESPSAAGGNASPEARDARPSSWEEQPTRPAVTTDLSRQSRANTAEREYYGRFPPGLPRFGQDFFKSTDVAGGLNANAPALPDYILSPGDEIQVYTWGRDSRNQTVVIDNEGMFNYPPLSPIRVSGLRFAAAQKLISGEIQKIHGVTASVGMGRLRSIRVMVLGEAVNPGSFAVPAGTTVTGALFRSGGVSLIGSLRAIEVRRSGKVVATLDLYEMLLRGNSKGDIQLLPGDAIFIPLARAQIAVHGMVKRPAIYEIRPGTKALEAVDLAGGLQSAAFKGRIRLDRVQANKRNIVIDVDMEKGGASNVAVQDGDVLYVDSVLDRTDAVYLAGNVNRPGRYQYKKGMTVRDLLPALQDLKPETFFEYAHIHRPAPDDERPLLLNFSLADVFTKGLRVPLEPRDTVRVYSRYEVVERPTVSISGTVRSPGIYGFSEGMSVSDLIILGGGLADAHLQEAHLVRMVGLNRSSDSLNTQLIRVNLRNVLENPTSEENIELQPFDQLRVFSRTDFNPPKVVGIFGAVNQDGSYELSEGMGVKELITRAGGLNKNSYTLGIEVSRRNLVGDSAMVREVLKLNLRDLLEGRSDFTLKDGDGVYVREVINSRRYTSIVLSGEFSFPGRYEFTPGERLSQVIRRAGGFTPDAYLRGAIFLRRSVREQQLRHAEEVGRRLEGQLQARLQQSTQEAERAGLLLAMERRRQLLSEISRAPYLGRVVIKLDRRLKFEDTDWDLELEHGDSLWVGPKVSTVSVLGEVSSPTTVIHTRKTNQVGEVLGKAGGVNTYGDYKETFYIAPDGSITTPRTTWWFKCRAVEPGGTVIVPLKPPKKDYLEIWAQSTQILYQLAITVGVATALF